MKTFLSPAFSWGRIYVPGVLVILATLLVSGWVMYPKVKAGNERNKAEAERKAQLKEEHVAARKPVSTDGTARH
jgi:type II secretory pathway component PulJ